MEDRRTGRGILYRFKASTKSDFRDLLKVLREAAAEIPEASDDSAALKLALARRQDRMRAYFDELAGKFGRHYVPRSDPGKAWPKRSSR